MQANRLSGARGWAWLREGLQLWLRNPALLTFTTFGYLLALLIISLVPILGQLAASLIMPALSVSVLNACRAVDTGKKIGPEVLLSGFRGNLPALISIGGLYLIGTVIVLLLVSVVDDGTLMQMMRGEGVTEEAVAQSNLSTALLVGTALSTPVMMAYWFAPMLAAWWKVPAVKAMFFSFHACLRNWRAFLAYSVTLALFCAVLPATLIAALGLISPMLGTLASVPVPLVVIPVVFASFYVNARDVFGLPDGDPARGLRAPADRPDAG